MRILIGLMGAAFALSPAADQNAIDYRKNTMDAVGGHMKALGEIASAEALPSLRQALNDPEESVRAKASWAIAEIQ